MDRRDAMRALVVLLAGAEMAACGPNAKAPYSGKKLSLFSAVGDTLIPDTDTKGALACGAVTYAAEMVVNWANADTRNQLDDSLKAIEAAAKAAQSKSFADLAPAERLAVLRAYDFAEIAKADSPWRKLKDLFLLSYYLSEEGATKELRYDLVPGVWHANIPLGPDRRGWAMH